MGTFNEFVERLNTDSAFVDQVNAAVAARLQAGDKDTNKVLISIAEENGYSITEEEIEAFRAQHNDKVTELSEEEMGKVSGGFLILASVVLTMGALSYAAATIADQLRDK